MKKYLTDNFGYTLRNIRENLKFTQTEVFQAYLPEVPGVIMNLGL